MRVEAKWEPHSSRSVAIGWVNVHAHLDGGARLVSAPEACSRARARDERVAAGDERIGWGGCG